MIADVGKNPCVMRLEDGRVLSFFNQTLSPASDISYIDVNGQKRYSMGIDTASAKAKNRALHFVRSYPLEAIDTLPRPVVFTPPQLKTTESTGISCTPLYEVISPQISHAGRNSYQLTFWTNVSDVSSLSVNPDTGGYLYTPEAVVKFSTGRLGDADNGSAGTKILCTCPIHLELLAQTGGGAADGIPMLTPVIQSVAVIAVVPGENYALDFSAAGSGGGFRRHSHSSNSDGGFAYAVYAPSAIIRPLSWS